MDELNQKELHLKGWDCNMKTKVDEKKFNCVKILLESNTPWKEIMDYMEISNTTLGRIRQASTFEEYKQIQIAAAISYKQKEKKEEPKEQPKEVVQVVEHRQSVQIQATHYMQEQMREMNEYLKLISAKLAFIVEELTK